MDHPFKAAFSDPSSSGYHLTAENEFTLSSALDLSSTSAGITSSLPASPTGLAARDGSVSRRRLSWGRMQRQHVDMLSDPLRVESVSTNASSSLSQRSSGGMDDLLDGGLHMETQNEYAHLSHSNGSRFYGKLGDGAPNASESSLIPEFRSKSQQSEYNDIELDDDEARLTGVNHLTSDDAYGKHASSNSDVERTPMRKSVRYSTQPSTSERLRSVKRNLRRMSLRVVNLASAGLEERARGIRLLDDDEYARGKEDAGEGAKELNDNYGDGDDEELPDLAARLPIRGRTMGFLDPTSRLRLMMYRFLTYSYVHLFSLHSPHAFFRLLALLVLI